MRKHTLHQDAPYIFDQTDDKSPLWNTTFPGHK